MVCLQRSHHHHDLLSPAEIHQIGLDEVKRIRKEMDAVIASTGFKGSFADFSKFLRTNAQFYYTDAESLLRGYRDIAKRIDPGARASYSANYRGCPTA